MTTSAPRPFDFDTVFADDGAVARASARPKRLYPLEEVEQIRAQAMAEGERAAMARIEAQQAAALSQIAQACQAALPRLAEVAHEHRVGSAELALACGQAIADAALDAFPRAPIQAALDSLAREIESAPRLVVTAPPALAENLEALLSQTAQAIGFAGQIQVRPDPAAGRAAFSLDFGDGAARFDPAAAAERVAAALHEALAAEGLHAEPLIPGGDA
ncbi:flagellar assembly protein FliH [Phenylobacterium sp.]|uniref:flagellar assembly protein FliH n=1 Tax=Phenylobacterium sp. TaxID=1871053 RepID=UPI0008BCFBF4|nr:flagellar assembly protein FliH [Phenylobacterium sp.]MBA4793983.1 flagellar assembly protein FliH [Phenylobacterium sp.]MBC7166277.1 flagellar assembly protein FliH [Phenylobacterium sp.]OHB35920.1 MAG: flagellar assembly protein FliH [Phenylobacterium sp. RIFCSPHIGHO2_01_FULL_70_10]